MFRCALGALRAPSAQSNMNFKNKVTVLNIMRKGGFFTNRFSDARRLHQAVIFATGIAIEHASLFVEHGLQLFFAQSFHVRSGYDPLFLEPGGANFTNAKELFNGHRSEKLGGLLWRHYR